MKLGMVLDGFFLRALGRLQVSLCAVPAALPYLADRTPPSGDKLVIAGENGNRVGNVPEPQFAQFDISVFVGRSVHGSTSICQAVIVRYCSRGTGQPISVARMAAY